MVGAVAVMSAYRCYFLNDRDRIFRAEVIEAADDAAARDIARVRLAESFACHAVELWLGTARIDRIVAGAASVAVAAPSKTS